MKNGIYKHYKGKLYEVIGLALNTENREKLVVYKALYETPELEKEFGKEPIFVRPFDIFNENVKINGKIVKRFEFIKDK